ncbi:MAG: 50S ribosomal protein L11 methyltransferase [Methylococcaceae bacterium]
MAWNQLSVTSKETSAALISDLFSSLGALSVTFMDAGNQPVYEPDIGETRIWPYTKVIGLFDLSTDLDGILNFLNFQLGKDVLTDWDSQLIADERWELAWKDHFKPMLFGNRLWVCPTGEDKNDGGQICLLMDPGLAFGTGTHPTTSLCLEWLAANNVENKIVTDFGCGSGILAIAALLLGAKQAFAIDIDPQALTATQENAKKNAVFDRLSCYLPEQFTQQQADIVIANILANPLIKLQPKLSQSVMPSGNLILSGILADQSYDVVQAYQSDFLIDQPAIQKNWCRIDGTKY